jgi:aryl-alcohol dehydrogenase-like predicted oxidoreductase
VNAPASAFPGRALCLGTAQFGLDYGVANTHGRPSDAAAAAILAAARAGGVACLDTAVAYGSSEARLGRLGVDDFKVMTKLPALPPDCVDVPGWIEAQVRGSLARLRVPRLAALSLHRPSQLLDPVLGRPLANALLALKGDPRVGRLGVSIYSPDEIPALFDSVPFELVQAPYNVFDRRIAAGGWPDFLRERGCHLHLRSCFLQGLLLMPPSERPPWTGRWAGLFGRWDTMLRDLGMDALTVCLRFALGAPARALLVVGVDSPAQLGAILNVPGTPLDLPIDLACPDPDLIDPSRWPRNPE